MFSLMFLLKPALNTLPRVYENTICCYGYSKVNILMLLFHCILLKDIIFISKKNPRKYVL